MSFVALAVGVFSSSSVDNLLGNDGVVIYLVWVVNEPLLMCSFMLWGSFKFNCWFPGTARIYRRNLLSGICFTTVTECVSVGLSRDGGWWQDLPDKKQTEKNRDKNGCISHAF